jgi:hypothetical protein
VCPITILTFGVLTAASGTKFIACHHPIYSFQLCFSAVLVMEFMMLQTLTSSQDSAMAAIGHRTIANLIADDDLPGLQSLLESRRVNVDDRDEVRHRNNQIFYYR